MNDEKHNSFSDKEYFSMWGVNTEEEMHFYYDESNNCRKFWLDSTKENFNHDFEDILNKLNKKYRIPIYLYYYE